MGDGLRVRVHGTGTADKPGTATSVVRAGVAAVGTTVKIEIDIQAVQGDTLPVL
jgi:hypothetical protein